MGAKKDIATFPSSSSSAVYTVKEDLETGELSCDCRGWTMKKPGKARGCKHTSQTERLRGANPAPSPAAPPVPEKAALPGNTLAEKIAALRQRESGQAAPTAEDLRGLIGR